MELTQEMLHQFFTYDETTGNLIRKFKIGKAIEGKASQCKDRDGYLVIGVNQKLYRAHRLVWLYHKGEWPKKDIDHINRIRDDNRIENLREVTKSQNRQNNAVTKASKSGVIGVWLHKGTNKWCSSIGIGGKNVYIGSFDTIEEAAAAYQAKKKKLHIQR